MLLSISKCCIKYWNISFINESEILVPRGAVAGTWVGLAGHVKEGRKLVVVASLLLSTLVSLWLLWGEVWRCRHFAPSSLDAMDYSSNRNKVYLACLILLFSIHKYHQFGLDPWKRNLVDDLTFEKKLSRIQSLSLSLSLIIITFVWPAVYTAIDYRALSLIIHKM